MERGRHNFLTNPSFFDIFLDSPCGPRPHVHFSIGGQDIWMDAINLGRTDMEEEMVYETLKVG